MSLSPPQLQQCLMRLIRCCVRNEMDVSAWYSQIDAQTTPRVAFGDRGDTGDGVSLDLTWSQISSHFFSLSYWLSSFILSGGRFMEFCG